MNALAALGLVALAHFAPDVLSQLMGGTPAAWDYMMQGTQAAALWLAVAALVKSWSVRLVCTWGTFEAMQRPICRAYFPLDRPAPLQPGESLCGAAFGEPLVWFGLFCALFVVALTQEARDAA